MHETASKSLTPGRRYLALLAVVTAVWAVMMDAMAVSVALPILAHEFGATAEEITWVVAISQLVTVALLLVLSNIGDKVGHRRVHQAGLVIFVVATTACALASSLPMLVAVRGIQAVGAACVLSLNFALVRHLFPDDQLGWAVGLVGTSVAVATCVGPSAAGVILSLANWRWLFYMTIPLGITSLMLGIFVLPQTGVASSRSDAQSG